MARKQTRRFTVEEKVRILTEARQPQTTVAEVLPEEATAVLQYALAHPRLLDFSQPARWHVGPDPAAFFSGKVDREGSKPPRKIVWKHFLWIAILPCS